MTTPLSQTALVMIGYQNDYFADDGILHSVVEASLKANHVLSNTLELLDTAGREFGLVVSTPIHFTSDYAELQNPVGILQVIKEVGAFKAGTNGAQVIGDLAPYKDFIVEVPGKRGLNAFSNTNLESVLRDHGIRRVVLAGAVTAICIDSTGRAAAERGFEVTVLSDCTSARTEVEQDFYCSNIFPLYAQVTDHRELLPPPVEA